MKTKNFFNYKYTIIPKMEAIKKDGYELKQLKIRSEYTINKQKIVYIDLNGNNTQISFSFLSFYKFFKKSIDCYLRYIKKEKGYSLIREKLIDFDLIEEKIKKEWE